MRYYQAQDTFSADLQDGTTRLVTKGDPLPESHELVKRDLAAQDTPGRVALFKPLAEDEPKAPRRARVK